MQFPDGFCPAVTALEDEDDGDDARIRFQCSARGLAAECVPLSSAPTSVGLLATTLRLKSEGRSSTYGGSADIPTNRPSRARGPLPHLHVQRTPWAVQLDRVLVESAVHDRLFVMIRDGAEIAIAGRPIWVPDDCE